MLRSFILRRRFRRRVEAAIAAGVLLPEQVDALRRRGPPIGEKPKIFEVHIDGRHKEGYEPSSTPVGLENVQDEWSNIMVRARSSQRCLVATVVAILTMKPI